MIEIYAKNFYECGYKIGIMFSEKIKKEISEIKFDIDKNEEINNWISQGLFFLKNDSEKCFNYLQGIADGAGVNLVFVFITWYEELYSFYINEEKEISIRDLGCTDISVKYKNNSLLLHTNDVEKGLKSDLIKLSIDGYPIVYMIGMNGSPSTACNSSGMIFSGNQIDSNDEKPGIPRMCLLFESIFCSKIEEVLQNLLNPRRSSSYNNIVADSFGRVLTIEASSSDYKIINHNDNSIKVHTNHFIYLPEKENKKDSGLTRSFKRLNRCLKELNDNNNLKNIIDILKTHGPDGVCRHAKRDLTIETNFSVIYVPKNKIFIYGEGSPCKTKYKIYKF